MMDRLPDRVVSSPRLSSRSPMLPIQHRLPGWNEGLVVRLSISRRSSTGLAAIWNCGDAGSDLDDSLREGIR